MSIKLAPYKMGSKSAKVLARSLGILRVRDTYVPKQRDFIINWGKSSLQTRYPMKVLNHPAYVRIAANKLLTYQTLVESEFDHLPEWTISKELAQSWIDQDYKVYCRTQLTGHSGSGIVISDSNNPLVDAPLYTRNVKSKYEYRIHVFDGKILDVQQKKKRLDWSGPSIQGIRNASNGWIYAREGVECNPMVTNAALEAVNILGLDFGAVDIGYNQYEDKCYVFEINTAPGLEGTTLQLYTEAIRSYYGI